MVSTMSVEVCSLKSLIGTMKSVDTQAWFGFLRPVAGEHEGAGT